MGEYGAYIGKKCKDCEHYIPIGPRGGEGSCDINPAIPPYLTPQTPCIYTKK